MPEHSEDLPTPDAAAREHSARLAAHIREAIAEAGGALPFADYMRLALYAPGLGYYRAGAEKFGAAGDFVTAPETSPLFGQVVARQIAETLAATGGDTVLELGAGSGRLALTILRTLAANGQLPTRYLILEVSGELAARQKTVLATEPALASRVEWIERLPETPIAGVILANEVADALSVECFAYSGGQSVGRGVRSKDNGFAWCEMAPSRELDTRVSALASRHNWPDDYHSEHCPELGGWITALAHSLERGAVLLFDYGLPEREYYHPQRDQGTLICHYRHRAHDNPFLWPGLNDITAWVDFSALAAAAHAASLTLGGYTTQAHFLLGGGIGDALRTAHDEREQLRLSGEIKRLTLPSEMGEAFKAIALTRDCPPPSAFGFQNMVARLD
ncbi:MAG: class I SAM-dependent methyltransferase [Gammaproteobacteria bacterium]